MKKEVIVFKNPKSPISEVFRTLRTNIQFMNVNKKMKTLLITSTFPSEGKSWTASNLAVTFAQAGKRVVLIDSDMRKGRQYAIFGLAPKPGLSNYLSQVEINDRGELSEDILNYIQSTEVENLYVMTAGSVPPNPSELLVSSQMIRFLNDLKKSCDIIIIDGTPSELVTDSVILSRLVDATIVVTAHKITKKDALERVVKNIQNVGGNIVGVIINKVPLSAKRYSSKYYYYGDSGKSKSNTNGTFNTFKGKFSNVMKSFGKDDIESVKNETTIDSKKSIEEKEASLSINEGNEDIPKGLRKENIDNIHIENDDSENISLEKTNDILKQINDFLDKEKKKF